MHLFGLTGNFLSCG